ncbi:polysaccharide lyase family 8 super-sandwich domain-containing protein [Bacteroidota bacterium]
MKSRYYITFVFVCISAFTIAQSDFDIVHQRVVDVLLEERISDYQVSRIIQNFEEVGSWMGINYDDVSNTGFQHSRHADNISYLSRAFSNSNSEYYQSEEIITIIKRSLRFWCDHDFKSDNWWHNQIGVPNSLVNVLLLMGDKIEPELKKRTLEIVGRAHLDAPGARPGGDRIKIGSIAAKRVLATGDPEEFRKIMKVINDEIKFSTGDRGMQVDYSFHHRIHRVNNTTSYGMGYASAFAEWALYVKDTEYAFEKEKIEQLVDFYLDGICKQYIYGIDKDWSVYNRDVSRGHSFRPQGTSIVEELLAVTDYRKAELEDIINLRRGEAEPSASFCKFFWQTEHFVFQRPHFYTSVRMFSTRNQNMEQPYNSEGLKNHYKADGANFLSVSGDEYNRIWPVYDWQKIPGTTVMQKDELPPPQEIQKDGVTNFVGAVTDGLYGAACFDFISPHDGTRAHKSWFFFDEEYVCLGAGIEANFGPPIVTTVNQCLLNGEVVVKDSLGERILDNGEHGLHNVQWIHHDGVGYLFPEKPVLHISKQDQSGSWWEITHQSSVSREKVSSEVFKLWFDHGWRPQGRRGGFRNAPMLPKDVTYAYVVVPSVDVDELRVDREVEILANNRDFQAVKHNDLGIIQAVFFRAGSVQIGEGRTLVMDGPGALIMKLNGKEIIEITVADPSRSVARLHFSVSGLVMASDNPALDVLYDKVSDTSHLTIDLPRGDFAGQSVHVEL